MTNQDLELEYNKILNSLTVSDIKRRFLSIFTDLFYLGADMSGTRTPTENYERFLKKARPYTNDHDLALTSVKGALKKVDELGDTFLIDFETLMVVSFITRYFSSTGIDLLNDHSILGMIYSSDKGERIKNWRNFLVVLADISMKFRRAKVKVDANRCWTRGLYFDLKWLKLPKVIESKDMVDFSKDPLFEYFIKMHNLGVKVRIDNVFGYLYRTNDEVDRLEIEDYDFEILYCIFHKEDNKERRERNLIRAIKEKEKNKEKYRKKKAKRESRRS